MGSINKKINALDYFFTAITLVGVICTWWLARDDSNFPVFLILSIVFLPLLTFKIISSLLANETMFSGMPCVVRKADNPSLYWLVVYTYAFFDSLCAIYLIYYVFT